MAKSQQQEWPEEVGPASLVADDAMERKSHQGCEEKEELMELSLRSWPDDHMLR